MHIKRRFAQPRPQVASKPFPLRNHENRMDAGDSQGKQRGLHNFRVTRLCMGCTRLMNKKLEMQEFR